ncbi:hypothetical protein LMH73_009800 [Vibrio splendidus]|nr:hypothetical protein [Vibrio splendidus]MCC4883031.1 hypothetical protein [Vibrio splendidus]
MTIQILALLEKQSDSYVLVGLNDHHTSSDEHRRVMALLMSAGSINAVDVHSLDLIAMSLSTNNVLEMHCIGNIKQEKSLADCYTDVASEAKWTISDSDSLQISKCTSDDSKQWIISQVSNEQVSSTYSELEFISAEINIDDISESEIESLLGAYGYTDSKSEMIKEMGEHDFNLILAEMQFETEHA